MSDDRPEEPGRLPRFDVVLLGVGPDAHVASLFPEQGGIREKQLTVVGVRNSPKPPPERISLTLPAINTALRRSGWWLQARTRPARWAWRWPVQTPCRYPPPAHRAGPGRCG